MLLNICNSDLIVQNVSYFLWKELLNFVLYLPTDSSIHQEQLVDRPALWTLGLSCFSLTLREWGAQEGGDLWGPVAVSGSYKGLTTWDFNPLFLSLVSPLRKKKLESRSSICT